jgi:UDP-N-acetylmuramoyl-L-alanyl-D-glutamate--2,6-diaminopimelate ligase
VQLHDLLDDAVLRENVIEVRGTPAVEVDSIIHDSREAAPGALFCCIPGGTVDGHDFAPAAVAAGAQACVVEHFVPVDVTQVRVKAVRTVIGPLADRFYAQPSRDLRVLGVTGTNGKTTTTYLLESIARAGGECAGVIGTTGARLDAVDLPLRHTTPEATELQALFARMRADGASTVAMEVSSHALDQHRVDGTWFSAACFTNLSHDHLDYHGTIDAYFAAKARLFTPQFTERAAVNIADPHGAMLADRARADGVAVYTYSAAVAARADVTARAVTLAANRTEFELGIGRQWVAVTTALVGRFNVDNALAAAATAHAAGFDIDSIATGLAAPVRVPGRMELIPGDGGFAVLVDYAHTPDALESVLDAARGLVAPGAQLVVVFGCGGDRDRAKRPVMGALASRKADRAILTSDNPRSEDPAAIAADVLAGIADTDRPLTVELDRRRAIHAAIQVARPGDVVVIAGKGHEPGQTAHGVTVPFDDREVAREELGARA